MLKKILAIIIAGVMILSMGAVVAFADEDDTEIITGDFPHGDTNLDLKVNIKDATLIQKHLAKIKTISQPQLELSDVDGKEGVNIKDATHLQKWLAGLAEELIYLKEKAEATTATADSAPASSVYESQPDETLPVFGVNVTEATEALSSVPATSEIVTDPTEATIPATSEIVTDPTEVTVPATSEIVTDPTEATIPATSEIVTDPTEATIPATSEIVTDPTEATVPATSEIVTDPTEVTIPTTSEIVTDPAESTVTEATSTATEATEATEEPTKPTEATKPTVDPDAPITLPFVPAL